MNLEAHIVQGFHAWKCLGDVLHLEDGSASLHGVHGDLLLRTSLNGRGLRYRIRPIIGNPYNKCYELVSIILPCAGKQLVLIGDLA